MSHSLFAYPVINAQAVTTDEKVYTTYGSSALPATSDAALNVKRGGALRLTIFSSASVKVTLHVTPSGGTLASGVVNGDTALIAGGISLFVIDVPRDCTFDLSFGGATTVTVIPALVLGAVA
jgi:hypothetical protein